MSDRDDPSGTAGSRPEHFGGGAPAPSSGAPGYAQAGQGPSGPRAGFWQRLGAWLIDSLLVSVVVWIIGALLGLGATGAGAGERPFSGIIGLVGLVLGVGYYVYFEGSASGQTVGKRALSIRVIDFAGGASIGYGRAFIRYLGRLLSGFVCALGYLWMLWDQERQTWHDKFATSVVVPVSDYPVEKWPG